MVCNIALFSSSSFSHALSLVVFGGGLNAVEEQLKARKGTDKALSTLHHLVFGVAPKHLTVKKNLREFSGVVYGPDSNRARLESRLDGRTVPLLRDLCVLLGVRGGSRADMIKNIADFLEKPEATDAKPKAAKRKTSSSSAAKKKKSAKKEEGEKKSEKKKAAEPAKKKAKKESEKKSTKKSTKKN